MHIWCMVTLLSQQGDETTGRIARPVEDESDNARSRWFSPGCTSRGQRTDDAHDFTDCLCIGVEPLHHVFHCGWNVYVRAVVVLPPIACRQELPIRSERSAGAGEVEFEIAL